MGRLDVWGWIAIGLVLSALTIPWFLWGSTAVIAGVPLWLWWHVGWMLLASIVFWLFTQRAWGIGIESGIPDGSIDRGDRGGQSGPSGGNEDTSSPHTGRPNGGENP